ncbi:hypothetical protein PSTAB_3990 [Stutzerimonas stutzeri]|uniref:Uncharacterized protein n=1 Tax=Stutzerimonas stutzeri (strain ATCC 17588 / DSM 5190 / CCUG 11256 / JCM 5965 / LMG 11199 / NBRC 14165 / NCIMB 11358 / Stanier 221) TaxID=96563 RepID=F8H526_STUS2|nr:hypothetical protein PSTAB_3990 [Stutzerimonas stutzeri]
MHVGRSSMLETSSASLVSNQPFAAVATLVGPGTISNGSVISFMP